MRLAFLITCFNRRDITLDSIERLFDNVAKFAGSVDVYLTDDGCSDGTANAVIERFPEVRVLTGNGSLYWGGGTNLAWQAAAQSIREAYDYYVWLNDDSELNDYVLSNHQEILFKHAGESVIFVGAFVDPQTGQRTYGGITIGPRPMKQRPIPVSDDLQQCQAFNGNLVFISKKAFEVLGFIDSDFPHIMGDTDYGLRATKCGIPVYILPGVCGTCARNPNVYEPSRLQRLRQVVDPKKRPWAAWVKFCFRHGGWLAPAVLISPFIKALLGSQSNNE